jgi:hypothetical protein
MRSMLRLAFLVQAIRRMVAAFITTLPVLTGLVAVWICFSHFLEIGSISPRYEILTNGEIKASNGAAIEMINEINKFLISANSALFGLSGFFLNNYRNKIGIFRNGLAYLLALLLLGFGYFFAFKVYTEMISNLTQGYLGIDPDNSRILFYLRMEFKVCFSSSLILLSMFVSVFFNEKREGADEPRQKQALPESEAYKPSVI